MPSAHVSRSRGGAAPKERTSTSARAIRSPLPDACLLYPAHDYEGRTTTVGEEKRWNPRIGGEADVVGYMTNLGLPHPKQIDVAVSANPQGGKPAPEALAEAPSWGPVTRTFGGVGSPSIGRR